MVKSRVILKNCFKCDHAGAVMSKSCRNKTCKHFKKQSEQSGSSIKQSNAQDVLTTRTTKRERKPNPKFNESETPTENKIVNVAVKRMKRPKSISTETPLRRSLRNTEEARAARAKRPNRKEPMYGGEDICGQLSKEKQELAALFLSEINRKLSSAVWRL